MDIKDITDLPEPKRTLILMGMKEKDVDKIISACERHYGMYQDITDIALAANRMLRSPWPILMGTTDTRKIIDIYKDRS
jgi:phage tail protein X